MAATNIPTDRHDVKAANFRITGPGRYRLGNGEIVEIVPNDFEPMAALYPWKLKGSSGCAPFKVWQASGSFDIPVLLDIVEGPLANEPISSPFTFTGDGLYQLRNGDQVEINQPNGTLLYRANNHSGETPYLWYSNGNWTGAEEGKRHEFDIVARVEKPESAGLDDGVTSYIALRTGTGIPYEHRWSCDPRHLGHVDKDCTIIDLSKVPASAIVKPEPKRLKGWVNLWNYPKGKTPLAQGIYKDREHADETAQQWPNAERIACIEIEFTHGEGL